MGYSQAPIAVWSQETFTTGEAKNSPIIDVRRYTDIIILARVVRVGGNAGFKFEYANYFTKEDTVADADFAVEDDIEDDTEAAFPTSKEAIHVYTIPTTHGPFIAFRATDVKTGANTVLDFFVWGQEQIG